VLTCAGNDRSQVEPVRGTIARVVFLESGRTPLEEPDSASVVPASSMREGDADLGETLPQVAFFARTSLPASLKDLMRSKGPALSYQTPGHVQGLRRRQWLLRNRLDAGRPVRQRPAKRVTRPFLTRTTGSVAVPIGGHGWLQPECPRAIPNVIRPMVEVCSRTSATAADRVGIPVHARVSHLTGGVIQWCASRTVTFMGIRLRRRRRPVSRLRVPRPTRVALVRSRNSAASEVTRRSRGCAATSGV